MSVCKKPMATHEQSNHYNLDDVLNLSLKRRKALIEWLIAEEDFLVKHGYISRRACQPRSRIQSKVRLTNKR